MLSSFNRKLALISVKKNYNVLFHYSRRGYINRLYKYLQKQP